MPEPGVIVLAVYKPNATLLRRQIESIIDQSLREWRCVVGLDGPDPTGASLVREVIGGDSRFEVVEYSQNVGVYRHFERLLERIAPTAPWIALADQDDFWHQSKVETLVRALMTEGTTGASCQARVTSETGVVLGQTKRQAKPLIPLLMINEVTGCLCIFRTEILEFALPFPPASPLAVHDHWLGLCAMAMNGFHFSESVLHDYVQHEGNAIGEQKRFKVRIALRNAILGRVSWVQITSQPWEWRVAMADSLRIRASLKEARDLETIAHGGLSAHLIRLMTRLAVDGLVPLRILALLLLAAARHTSALPVRELSRPLESNDALDASTKPIPRSD